MLGFHVKSQYYVTNTMIFFKFAHFTDQDQNYRPRAQGRQKENGYC